MVVLDHHHHSVIDLTVSLFGMVSEIRSQTVIGVDKALLLITLSDLLTSPPSGQSIIVPSHSPLHSSLPPPLFRPSDFLI